MNSSRTRVKICGLRTTADVEAAARAGADAIGLVFHPGSARCVDITLARQLRAAVPAFVTTVALFVDPEPDTVKRVLDAVRPGLLQFHGAESNAYCASFGWPFIKALAAGPGVDLLNLSIGYPDAAGILLDTPSRGHGGSGKVFDWSLIPGGIAHPVVLSGGLDAANVGAAISRVRPWAVDVSSGVESVKGVKDPQRIHQFCAAVREADALCQDN